MKYISVFILLLSFAYAQAQGISEKWVFDVPKESMEKISDKIIFDAEGNYCFEFKDKKGGSYFLTHTDTVIGSGRIGSIYGSGGGISYTKSYSDPKSKPYYFKNSNGIDIHGPIVGEIESFQTSNTNGNIALVTTLGDSVYYYINHRSVARYHKKEMDEFYISSRDWVAFSENGNVIYFIRKNDSYHLYINDELIETSKFRFTQLAINNKGEYIFARGKKPSEPDGLYSYMFFVHTPDTILGPVRTVWEYQLNNNGAYYYSGDDNGPEYIIINNYLYKNIHNISNVTLLDKDNYLFTFEEDGIQKINVNGHVHTPDFESIFFPNMDDKGNFSCYGIKDYYLYKYINGKQQEVSISKYGVRAVPLYISPKGESLHYFRTDDSTYLYKDQQLVFPPIANGNHFSVEDDVLYWGYGYDDDVSNGHSLFYLGYGESSYLVSNGEFSRPISNDGKNEQKIEGNSMVAGEVSDHGFFVIHQIAKRKYSININNQVYRELEGVDKILYGNHFLDDYHFIFYGIKKNAIYQYKINL